MKKELATLNFPTTFPSNVRDSLIACKAKSSGLRKRSPQQAEAPGNPRPNVREERSYKIAGIRQELIRMSYRQELPGQEMGPWLRLNAATESRVITLIMMIMMMMDSYRKAEAHNSDLNCMYYFNLRSWLT